MNHRDKANGQYTHSKLDVLCRCGHTLGVHLAESPRECLNSDTGDGTPCDCIDYKKAKVKRD